MNTAAKMSDLVCSDTDIHIFFHHHSVFLHFQTRCSLLASFISLLWIHHLDKIHNLLTRYKMQKSRVTTLIAVTSYSK